MTNGEDLVENRDEALENFTIETRGIKEINGKERVERVLLKEGNDLLVDGVFVAIRNCF